MRPGILTSIGRASLVAVGLALLFTVPSAATDKTKTKKKKAIPVSKLKVDPKADHVGFFDGIKSGSLSVKVVAQDPFAGSMLIENRSNKPLTVDLPDSFVIVQRQFGGGGAGGLGGGRGGANNNAMGGAQPAGGGFGGMGGGMMGGGGFGGGGGMFSVPPEQVARVPYQSVCLEHGKRDPDSTVNYQVVPVDQFTSNDQLAALIAMVGTKQIDSQIAQAAAWHMASNMSWEELAAKTVTSEVTGPSDEPYFAPQSIYKAQQLVAEARVVARERAEKKQQKKDETNKPTSDDKVIKGR